MSQEIFEKKHQQDWDRFEHWITSTRSRRVENKEVISEIPHLYRQICHHLAMAKQRMYSPHLVSKLNRLVLNGHATIYKARAGVLSNIARFVLIDFPSAVRKERKLMGLSGLLLFGPLFAVAIIIQFVPDFAYSIVTEEQLTQLEAMYRPGVKHFGRDHNSTSNFGMFGFYIFNNISIGFRVFAGGMLVGLGTIFYLTFNGFYIGAIVGHLIRIGYASTILSFTAGHGSFELLAFVVAGCAGFKLGFSYVSPGRYSRINSLKRAARVCATLVWGVISMLVIAAFIEAYWSSLTIISPTTKYITGASLWIMVISYFIFVGRGYEPR